MSMSDNLLSEFDLRIARYPEWIGRYLFPRDFSVLICLGHFLPGVVMHNDLI